MEIGPELCFWNETSRSHQNGAQTPAQSFVGPSIYAQNPPSFRVPHLAGVVLELESESDNDSDNEVRWRDSTIEFRRSDFEETVKNPPQVGVQEPTRVQPYITTTNTQVDTFHRSVDVEDSLGADTLVTQEITVSNTSEVMDVSKVANQSTEARVQNQPVNNDNRNNGDSGSLEKPTVESDEGPGRTNQTSLSLTVPLTVDSIPTSPETSQRSGGSNLQSKVAVLPIGESETPRINRLSNGVQCVICARNFVDRRSRNIHMTKAHLGKTALSSGMSTGLKWLSCAVTLPENHSAVATTTNNDCRNVNSLPCLQTSEEQDAKIIEGYNLPALDTQDTTRSPSMPAAENDLGSEESTGSHNQHSPTSLSHSAIPTSPQSVVSNCSSHTKRRLSYAVSPSLNTPDAGCLKLRLVSVGNTGSKKSDQWDRSPQMDHARTPGFADSCSTDNTEPLGELEEGSPTKETKEDSPPRKIVRRTRSTTGKSSPEHYTFQESPLHEQAVSRSTPEKSRTNVPRTRYSEMDQGSQVKSLRSCVIASRRQSSFSPSPNLLSSSSQHQQRSASLKELSKLQARRPTMDTSLRTPEGLYKCRICKRLFPNRFSLTGHYKSHYNSSQKPYNCDDCGQRYTSPSNLHYHRARNCPILKLRDVKNGKVTPKSDRSFKLIQTKAIKAAERQALSRTRETRTEGMTAYDTPASEVHNNPVCRRSNATCQSVKRDQPVCSRQRLLLEAPDSHEGTRSNNLSNAIPPPVQQVVGSDPPRIPRRAPLRTDSSVPSAFKSNIPKTPLEPPPTSTQALEESSQSNNSLSYLHEQLRHLLEQACQSDEARQKILAFTSLALLSALGPLSKPEQAEANSLPNSVFEALFSRFPGLLNSSGCSTHVSARDAAHNEDLRQRGPPSTSAHSPLCTNRTNVAQSPVEHRPVSTGVEKPSPGYMCQYCRNPQQVFSDLTSFEAHLFLVHSNRSSRTPNSSSGHSSSPSITSSTTFQVNSQGPPVGLNASNQAVTSTHEQPTRPNNNTLRASPTSFFLKCSECDQPFSSFTDCQIHFTKMHQNYGMQRS